MKPLERMNHEQAVQLATELNNRYGLHLEAKDHTNEEYPEFNHSYLAFWYDEILIGTFNGPEQFKAFCEVAHIIVQTDEDMRQNEENHMRNDAFGVPLRPDLYDRDKSPVSTEERIAELPGDIPLQDVGQYY